jgi:hypothetical protein
MFILKLLVFVVLMLALFAKNLWQIFKLGLGKGRNIIQCLIYVGIMIGYVLQIGTTYIPKVLFNDLARVALAISFVLEGIDLGIAIATSRNPVNQGKKEEEKSSAKPSRPISQPVDLDGKKDVQETREVNELGLAHVTFALNFIAYVAAVVVTNNILIQIFMK